MVLDVVKRLNRYQFEVPAPYLRRQQAAVLLPIINSSDPCLVLTERATKLSKHGGEVAWPGGKQDEEDDSLLVTALRESEEEIGLPRDRVETIAQLRPFVSKFGLAVTPFVGLVDEDVVFEANEDEIAEIFTVPLKYLLADPRSSSYMLDRHGETFEVPEYHYDGFRIWGLTALILGEFMIHGLGVDMKLEF